jgi:hypothetical protein
VSSLVIVTIPIMVAVSVPVLLAMSTILVGTMSRHPLRQTGVGAAQNGEKCCDRNKGKFFHFPPRFLTTVVVTAVIKKGFMCSELLVVHPYEFQFGTRQRA